MTDTRTDLALVVCAAMRMEGWIVPPSAGYAVADAIIDRPGLVADLIRRFPAREDPQEKG